MNLTWKCRGATKPILTTLLVIFKVNLRIVHTIVENLGWFPKTQHAKGTAKKTRGKKIFQRAAN